MKSSLLGFSMLGAACLAAAPGPAAAYEGDPTVRARAAVVRGGAPGAPGEKSHVFEIRTEDGKVTVRVDGKEVPADRLRIDGGRIIVLDETGKEIKGIALVATAPGGLFALGEAEAELEAAAQAHPPVMLGIHMSDPDEALQCHLRLEPDQTSIVTALYEGLPAHKAGLAQYDVIVAVDGNRPAGPREVLEALSGKADGDTLVLTVIHEGKTAERSVRLEAWDSERMKAASVIGAITPEGGFSWPGGQLRFEHLFDGDGNLFQRFNESGLSDLLKEHVQEQLPPDLDSRLEHLNQRIDEIKELIDRLILQARDLARESEEKGQVR